MSPEFLLTSLIVVIMPGTGVIYTLAQGLSGGKRAALAATLGCTLGIVPHIAASIFGLAAILHTSAVAFQIVKYAGVAYLFYLAWSSLRDGGTLDIPKHQTQKRSQRIAIQGFLINILNPKLSIFFLAFLPQFVPSTSQTAIADMMMLSAVFMVLTAIVFAIYGLAAAQMQTLISTRPAILKWLRRGFASAFGALGVRLALAER